MNQFNLVRATVTDNRDPDRTGRVRLRYHWFGQNDSAQQQSEWAPVLRETSHPQGGSWSLPDVGDEVLVGFEFGNLAAPLVLGSLFTKTNKPPLSGKPGDGNGDGKNSLRFIKTRAGHLLAFDDTNGARAITLQDAVGNQILLSSDPGEIQVRDKNGNEIHLNSQGVTIKTAGEIHLGEGASEALIKGKTFSQLFNSHTHSTGVGPSGPPSVPMSPAQHLSQKVKTL